MAFAVGTHSQAICDRCGFQYSYLDLKKEWKVSEHRTITDKTFLPDKDIKNEKGEVQRQKPVNRIAIPVQKYIVGSAISFGFGNPVQIKSNAEEGSEEEIVEKDDKPEVYDLDM